MIATAVNRVLVVLLTLSVLGILIAGALVVYEIVKTNHSWGTSAYVVSFEGKTEGYVFKEGVFTTTNKVPAAVESAVAQSADGLTYCSASGACAPLISFGAPVAAPVAYTLTADTLVFVHPLTSELQGYRLIETTTTPTVQPLFSFKGLLIPDATSVVQDARDDHRFLFVRSALVKTETTETRVCFAELAADYSAITRQDCAAVLSPGEPVRSAIHSAK